jgi:hypothetical protein
MSREPEEQMKAAIQKAMGRLAEEKVEPTSTSETNPNVVLVEIKTSGTADPQPIDKGSSTVEPAIVLPPIKKRPTTIEELEEMGEEIIATGTIAASKRCVVIELEGDWTSSLRIAITTALQRAKRRFVAAKRKSIVDEKLEGVEK